MADTDKVSGIALRVGDYYDTNILVSDFTGPDAQAVLIAQRDALRAHVWVMAPYDEWLIPPGTLVDIRYRNGAETYGVFSKANVEPDAGEWTPVAYRISSSVETIVSTSPAPIDPAAHAALVAERDALRAAAIDAGSSLAAAISLLERTPKAKKAAPSDTMFAQMLVDYRAALDRTRTALAATEGGQHG